MAERIRGRYEPLQVIGRGGQGQVLKAIDHQHDRLVAMKVRLAGTPEARQALLSEARILLAMRPHPHLPLAREDFFEGDRYYLVMDWVQGDNLSQLLRERPKIGLDLPRVLSLLGPIAKAIDHLHSHEPPIVHGDVKPANIVLATSGAPILVDLGHASSSTPGASGSGTRGYRAPEVATGPPSPASDIYGLAATAFALIGGAPPPEGRLSPAELGIRKAAALEAALRVGLATNPKRRPETAASLVESLGTVQGPMIPPSTSWAIKWVRRGTAAALLAFTMVGLAIPVQFARNQAPAQSAVAPASPTPSPAAGDGQSEKVSSGPSTGGSVPAGPRAAPVPPSGNDVVRLGLPIPGQYRYQVDWRETWDGPLGGRGRAETSDMQVVAGKVGAYGAEFVFYQSYTDPDATEPFKPHQEWLTLALGPTGVHSVTERLEVGGCDPGEVAGPCPRYYLDFSPALLVLPYPGVTKSWRGSSEGIFSGGGDVQRTESYLGTNQGWASIEAAGLSLDVVVSEWSSEFTGTHTGRRTKKVWFSPERGVFVRWEESMSWESEAGSYASSATWDLRRLAG